MSKKRFFIPLAAFSLLFSTIVACNANNNNQPSASGKGDESSQPAPSSTDGGGGAALLGESLLAGDEDDKVARGEDGRQIRARDENIRQTAGRRGARVFENRVPRGA